MNLTLDYDKSFDYENQFYLTCDITRMSKMLAQYELFKMVMGLPGEIVECGVFKGASFARFAMLRSIFGNVYSKKLIGFDIFGKFPETDYQDDIEYRKKFIESAGDSSITKKLLLELLEKKGVNQNIELVEGDITATVPQYLAAHPELKISLLNLDTDIYEPAKAILDDFYPRLVTGGIILLDDYGKFPGETKAVDEYFKDQNVSIKKFSFAMTPCYIIKQ